MLDDLRMRNVNLYAKPDANYDAWCCITGVSRPCFDVAALLCRYPSLRGKVRLYRERLNIRLTLVDRKQKLSIEVNSAVRDVVDYIVRIVCDTVF